MTTNSGVRFAYSEPNTQDTGEYIDEDIIAARKKRAESLRRAALKEKRRRRAAEGFVEAGGRHRQKKEQVQARKRRPENDNTNVDPKTNIRGDEDQAGDLKLKHLPKQELDGDRVTANPINPKSVAPKTPLLKTLSSGSHRKINYDPSKDKIGSVQQKERRPSSLKSDRVDSVASSSNRSNAARHVAKPITAKQTIISPSDPGTNPLVYNSLKKHSELRSDQSGKKKQSELKQPPPKQNNDQKPLESSSSVQSKKRFGGVFRSLFGGRKQVENEPPVEMTKQKVLPPINKTNVQAKETELNNGDTPGTPKALADIPVSELQSDDKYKNIDHVDINDSASIRETVRNEQAGTSKGIVSKESDIKQYDTEISENNRTDIERTNGEQEIVGHDELANKQIRGNDKPNNREISGNGRPSNREIAQNDQAVDQKVSGNNISDDDGKPNELDEPIKNVYNEDTFEPYVQTRDIGVQTETPEALTSGENEKPNFDVSLEIKTPSADTNEGDAAVDKPNDKPSSDTPSSQVSSVATPTIAYGTILAEGDIIEMEPPDRNGSESRQQNLTDLKAIIQDHLGDDLTFGDWLKLIECGFGKNDTFEIDPKYAIAMDTNLKDTKNTKTKTEDDADNDKALYDLMMKLERDNEFFKFKIQANAHERAVLQRFETEEEREEQEKEEDVQLSYKEQKDLEREQEKAAEAKRLRDFVNRFTFDAHNPNKTPDIPSPTPTVHEIGVIAKEYQYNLKKKTKEFRVQPVPATKRLQEAKQELRNAEELMWTAIKTEFVN